MARLKLYYPADEIVTDLYTSGREFMTADNVEYVGSYHRYTTGEVYTGATWNSKSSLKLIPHREQIVQVSNTYKTLKPNIKVKYALPYAISVQPTREDIRVGFMTRYFIKQQTSSTIFEIDKLQYDSWKNNGIDRKLYQAVQLIWYISGQITDTNNGTVQTLGVQSKNELQIKNAAQTINNISSYLTNTLEYYTDNDFSVPVDINGLDS
jgi:hypothetical protein